MELAVSFTVNGEFPFPSLFCLFSCYFSRRDAISRHFPRYFEILLRGKFERFNTPRTNVDRGRVLRDFSRKSKPEIEDLKSKSQEIVNREKGRVILEYLVDRTFLKLWKEIGNRRGIEKLKDARTNVNDMHDKEVLKNRGKDGRG